MESLRTDMRESHDEVVDSIKTDLSGKLDRMESKHMEAMHKSFKAFDDNNCSKFSALEEQLNSMHDKQDDMQAEFIKNRALMQESIKKLEQGFRISSAPEATPATRADNAFDRTPDLTILRVNAQEHIAKDKLSDVLTPRLAEIDIMPASFDITGPAQGKFFNINFKGLPGHASKLAGDANESLFVEGKRREFTILSPTNVPIKLWINEDKNKKRIKEESTAARLHHHIKFIHDDRKVHCDRKNASVYVDWILAARVVAKSASDPVKIWWNQSAITKFKLKTNQIEELLKDNVRPGEETITWV